MGDIFRDMHKRRKAKRASNSAYTIKYLNKHNIKYKTKNGVHLIVGDYNFWPSTGLFIHRENGERGRGLMNLLKRLNRI